MRGKGGYGSVFSESLLSKRKGKQPTSLGGDGQRKDEESPEVTHREKGIMFHPWPATSWKGRVITTLIRKDMAKRKGGEGFIGEKDTWSAKKGELLGSGKRVGEYK